MATYPGAGTGKGLADDDSDNHDDPSQKTLGWGGVAEENAGGSQQNNQDGINLNRIRKFYVDVCDFFYNLLFETKCASPNLAHPTGHCLTGFVGEEVQK